MQQTNRVHSTANLEEGVKIGENTQVWDHVHIRKNTQIGSDTIIGEKSYIAYNVIIGNYVKINSMVYICTGVTIEDMCMISAGTVFTNDTYPRAMNRDLSGLEKSDPTENTLRTTVEKGCTIGANATIGPGLVLGSFSMIGMGSVVTKNIPSYALAVGNPAKIIGYVCICGPRLEINENPIFCHQCQRKYAWNEKGELFCHE